MVFLWHFFPSYTMIDYLPRSLKRTPKTRNFITPLTTTNIRQHQNLIEWRISRKIIHALIIALHRFSFLWTPFNDVPFSVSTISLAVLHCQMKWTLERKDQQTDKICLFRKYFWHDLCLNFWEGSCLTKWI